MGKHLVKWKPTAGKNIRNEDTEFPFPDLLNSSVSWTLLERIFEMETKKPISFTDAALLAQAKYQTASRANRHGDMPGECEWYTRNFVEWISSLGYHIELDGDEFELHGRDIPTA